MDRPLSGERAVWSRQSDASGCGVDTLQHRGGIRHGHSSRVCAVPPFGSWLLGGAANAGATGHRPGTGVLIRADRERALRDRSRLARATPIAVEAAPE